MYLKYIHVFTTPDIAGYNDQRKGNGKHHQRTGTKGTLLKVLMFSLRQMNKELQTSLDKLMYS